MGVHVSPQQRNRLAGDERSTRTGKPRRGRGEGTIRQNPETGRWEGRLDLGVGPNGRRIRRKVSGKHKDDVTRQLRELSRQRDDGLVVARRMPTVGDTAARWLATGAGGRKAESTLSRVRRRVETHLIPAVGAIRLDALTPENVETWLGAESAGGASLRTLQDYRGDLRQILTWMQRRSHLARNVAAVAEIPRDARRPVERHTLNVEQAAALLDSLGDHRLGPYWTVLLLLGLRPGEADALTWNSIEGDNLVIDRALQRDDAGRPLGVGPTKTKATRVLRMPAAVAAALRRQKVQQSAERLAWPAGYSTPWDGHVFLNEVGRPPNPSNVRRDFKIACQRAGLPPFTPYELRHSTASLLIAAGVPPFEVADLLGHADLRMLERHYRHKLNPVVATAQQLANLLGRPDLPPAVG
jgi:integrase